MLIRIRQHGVDAMSPSNELHFMTAGQLLALMNRREVSCVELARLFIGRCKALNPRINAVVTLAEERALAEATESDRRRARNEAVRPLEGLPFTVKDTLSTQGLRSTAGTRKLANYIPERDAATVAHLRAAGAIVIGKSNVPELGGDIDCDNPVFGPASNPWNLSHVPGGSSGGEGAAVASGLNAFGLGSDTGGSVRIPAHFCGVAGFKPGWATVSRSGHLPPESAASPPLHNFATVGPLARCVNDLTLAYNALKGPSWDSPNTVPSPDVQPDRVRLGNLRCAFFTDLSGHPPAAPEIKEAAGRAARLLSRRGVIVDELTPPIAEGLQSRYYNADGRRLNLEWYGADIEHCRPKLLKMMVGSLAGETTAADFFKASMRRDELRCDLAKFMETYPIILTVPCCITAFRHDAGEEIESGGAKWHRLAMIWPTVWPSFYGLPAAVVPAGLDRNRLPLGVQIVGRAFEEERVLAIARALEEDLGGFQPPPL
jgi:amidase